jgi:MFS family permease
MADSIAATLALPAIATSLPGLTEVDLQWVLTAYAVPFAALLAAAGRLADLLGRRRLLAVGLGLFSLGAAAAAVSPDFPVLLAARFAQGVGSAAVIPASLGMLLAGISAERRAAAIGLWIAAAGIGGLLLHAGGGWLCDALGWRALFVPSALAGTLLVYGTYALPRTPGVSGRIPDPIGGAALFLAIGSAVVVVTKIPAWGWGARTAALSAAALLLLLVAVRRSARHPVPVLQVALWRTPMFGRSGAVSLLHGLIAFPVLAISPIFLHQVWGYGLAVTGSAMAPISGGVLVSSLVAGRVCRRYGPRVVICAGTVVVAAACLWLMAGAIGPEPRLVTVWLPATALLGAGLGAMTTGASAAGALSVPAGQYAAAVGGTMTARQVGGAVGTAAAAVLVTRSFEGGPLGGYTVVFAGCAGIAAAGFLLGLFVRPVPPPGPPGRIEAEAALRRAVAAFAGTAARTDVPAPSPRAIEGPAARPALPPSRRRIPYPPVPESQ